MFMEQVESIAHGLINMYFLNRFNINTKTAEEKLMSVKAAEIYILGVLCDGKIIFWYKFTQGEKGICITK
jgi:hypothetical protein